MVTENRIVVPVPSTPAEHGVGMDGYFGAVALSEVPEIAQAVALTIAHMSDADMTLQQIAIGLMGGEGLAAATVFGSINSPEVRLKIVKNLLASNARAADRTLIQNVMTAIEPLRKIRNDFAHGIWGASSGLPDHLMLTKASAWNARRGAAHQLTGHNDSGPLPMFLNALLDGSSGSQLSATDKETLSKLLIDRSHAPAKRAAMEKIFDQETENAVTQVWSIELAWQAVSAAEAASQTVIGLQICMDRTPEEASQLRQSLLSQGLLTRHPLQYLNHSTSGAP